MRMRNDTFGFASRMVGVAAEIARSEGHSRAGSGRRTADALRRVGVKSPAYRYAQFCGGAREQARRAKAFG